MGSISAATGVGLAAWLAYAARETNSRLNININRLVGLGYAVPGTIIAVGVLIPVIRLNHALVDRLNNGSGAKFGLLLTGSLGILVYAYLIRFLAAALQRVEAGLAKITPSMDDAARSLGSSRFQRLRRVQIPLLRPSIITAA